MNIIIKFLLIAFCFVLIGCSSKDKKEVSIIEEKEIEFQMIDAYKEGIEALENGDALLLQKNLMKQAFYIPNLFGLLNLLLWQLTHIIHKIIMEMLFLS